MPGRVVFEIRVMRKRKYSSLQTPSCKELKNGTPLPVVHNIVATSQILSSLAVLDLNRIHELLPFSFYDQNKFAAITVRLHEPDCTTLLFSSGKLVVTGCRTWYECVYSSLFIADLLSECLPGHTFILKTCDVQNMVAHVELPVGNGCLDLQGMYSQMALNCTYQRKMFPGLIFRPEASPVVLLCFFSGKVVITGGKNMDDVFSGWSRLWPILKEFITSEPSTQVSAQKKTRAGSHESRKQSVERRECDQRLPLERHTTTCKSPGSPHLLEESAWGSCAGT
jgi:transcription initiation factor TFIID TATA-box-binding protein